MKTALNKNHAWEIQDQKHGEPHGWIQWKGTNVCMDVYCECGAQFHIDADFAYYVRCPACFAVYMCNGHIELIKLTEEPHECVVTDLEYDKYKP